MRHPDRDNWTTVRALVDTGSTDCEVKAEVIAALDLPDTGETATFETAIGRVQRRREKSMHWCQPECVKLFTPTEPITLHPSIPPRSPNSPSTAP